MHKAVDFIALVRWINVVKLEYQRVCDTAVNARLLGQVRPDPFLQLFATGPRPLTITPDIRLLVERIVAAAVGGHTRLAPAMLPPCLLAPKAELA